MRKFLIIFFIFLSFSLVANEFNKKNIINTNKKLFSFSNIDHGFTKFAAKKSSKVNVGRTLRNAGIGLFLASMTAFTIFIAADIASIILSEEEVIFPDGNYDWKTIANIRWALWALIAGFGVFWLVTMIPGIILMARGHYLLKRKRNRRSQVSFKQWCVNDNDKQSLSAACVVKF